MDANDAREVARLWKVNRTLHEMCRDRGYLVGADEIDMTFEQFSSMYAPQGSVDRRSMSFFCTRINDQTDRIIIGFNDEENVSKKAVKTFVQQMDEQKFRRGILVYKKKMTPAGRKLIQEMHEDYAIEEYAETDLVVNITKHFLVPKHEVMNKEEKAALLERYRLKETQLPRIQMQDPVARYYGVSRGQVMKITRESETAGRYVTYRIAL